MDERELEQLAALVVEKLRSGSEPETGSAQRATVNEQRSPLPDRIAAVIDHTLLKPEATRSDIEMLCAEGVKYQFAAVCVDGSWVELCVDLVKGTGVTVVTVVGFPHGAMTSGAKAMQAAELVGLGADEIDMVAPVGRIITEDWDYVEHDVRCVVEAADGCVVKVILETAALTATQIVLASAIAMEAGAHFVKTSTGFHPAGGATEEAVALMSAAVGHKLGVKAAGGIRNCVEALRMIAAGATRIGMSSGVDLVECVGDTRLAELLPDPDGHLSVCRNERRHCP